MNAHILNIGDEILIGQILNSNAQWLAAALAAEGIPITQMKTVADEAQAIEQALKEAEAQADILLITGGLGPTKDDITKNTMAKYFGMELAYHEPSFRNIETLFATLGRTADDRYKEQCFMPAGALILQNKQGTAPGMWFERNGKVMVSMPGVPREMKYLMENEVLPRLRERFRLPALLHQTLHTTGRGETDLSGMLHDFETALPGHFKLAYLPNTMEGIVRLRLTAKGESREALQAEFDPLFLQLQTILGPKLVYDVQDQPLERVLGELLLQGGQTLSTAESCTGGYIGHRLTSVPGCSAYYKGGTVVYSNELKMNLLGVFSSTLDQYGAVSEAAVREMAAGSRLRLGTDYAIAVSGIAGPDGGRPDKPVGTVWVAVAGPERTAAKRFQFGNDRQRTIQLTTTAAMNMLRLMLLGLLE